MPSLNWLRVALVALLVAGTTAGLWKIRHDGVNAGRAEVQASWDAERVTVAKQVIATEKKYRATEQSLRDESDQLRKTLNGQIAKVAIDLDAARAANRLLHSTPRPANFTAPAPGTGPGCSAASLFTEDADAALRLAAEADVLRFAYLQCEAQYGSARQALEALQ
jgi:hypothetical protein